MQMAASQLQLNPETAAAAATDLQAARREVERVIVGQKQLLDILLMSLLTQGHSLLIGVPGLAKTRSVRALADALALSFSRIQFTPDLLPSDITGSELLSGLPGGERGFKFEPGPIFANLLLADEINRTPPRTQAALLEAMQERAVTVGKISHKLPAPFLVLATQNPVEQEGTFPLPEAQLDRFYFSLQLDYPSQDEEIEILRRTTAAAKISPSAILTAERILQLQQLTAAVAADTMALDLAVRLSRLSRPSVAGAPKAVNDYVAWGAGPRAGQVLIWGAKAMALMAGRTAVALEDIVDLAPIVLAHRLVLNFNAERDRIFATDIVRAIRDAVQLEV